MIPAQLASEHPSASGLQASALAAGSCRSWTSLRHLGRRQRCQSLSMRIPCASPDLLLKHPNATVATCNEDRWNIWNMHLKHLQKHLKTLRNHCKHPDETLATNVWNTSNHLKNTLATCLYMQHPDLLLQHLDKNTCNIRLMMKHLEHILETYVYSHCNICNIPIYFVTLIQNTCNIHLKHLKHMFATCVFHPSSFVISQPTAEDGGAV
jgi:hypothetical protein